MIQKIIDALNLIISFLEGKKSYIIALATVVSAWLGWKMGVLTPEMAYFATLGALGLGSLRSAVNK